MVKCVQARVMFLSLQVHVCLYCLLFTVSPSEANYNFTIRFYEFYTPAILCPDDECRGGNCTTQQSINCSISFRFLLRPFGASVETAPTSSRHFSYFTPNTGDNNETFDEGPDGFLGLPNPFTITNHTGKWTGMIQLFIDALDNKVQRGGRTQMTVINRFPVDLELNPGADFTERTTYTGFYNIPDVGFDMSFRVQCLKNYFGLNCTTFCEPLEGVYTCDIEACNSYDPNQNMSSGCILCLNSEYDPKTKCRTTCLLIGYDPSRNCEYCLPGLDMNSNCTQCSFGYNPTTNCSTCLPGRDPSSNCTQCSLGYDPSKDCSICLPGRNINSICTECLAGLDLSTTCSECVNRKLDASTNCSECVNRKLDPSTGCTLCLQRGQNHTSNCTECLQNYDKNTSCSTCLFSWDISTSCTECQPNRNITNSCRTCNNHSMLIGSNCTSVDPCALASKPSCQNGGTCVAVYSLTPSGYYCLCKSGYGGPLCEVQQSNTAQVASSQDQVVPAAVGGVLAVSVIMNIVLIIIVVVMYIRGKGSCSRVHSPQSCKVNEEDNKDIEMKPNTVYGVTSEGIVTQPNEVYGVTNTPSEPNTLTDAYVYVNP